MILGVPIGIDKELKRRPLLSLIVPALILYRAILSAFFPVINLKIIHFFPVKKWSWDVWAAILQSGFTPAFPADAPHEHSLIIFAAMLVMISFWLMFGPSLEDLLGPAGFATLYGAGMLAGLGIATAHDFGITEAFWLGHTAALLCMGFCYAAFSLSDIRVRYVYWFPWIAAGSGTLEFPAIVFLLPAHLCLIVTQLDLWYRKNTHAVLWRDGAMNPLAWQVLLPIIGVVIGFVTIQLKRGPRSPLEKKKAPVWGA